MPEKTRELPLFPLPEVILFPDAPLRLHIFEMKYRQMLSTILEGDHCFGVLLWNPILRRPASVGCRAEVVQVEKLPDGRSNILTIGRRRFRVLETSHDRPYLVGRVEEFEDKKAKHSLTGLSAEVDNMLRDVVRLSAKLRDKCMDYPDDVPTDPLELSFWVAGSLLGLSVEQQALLEMDETAARLRREAELLDNIRKELAARTVLKDALR
ncbi:MAG: LON peptidase substrate-binding domain-containing protein [Candidatus Obscuribacterales bacterium]